MTNPLLQSQLERFDEKFPGEGLHERDDIWDFVRSCDKERLMWVVELIASAKKENKRTEKWSEDYNIALSDILSLIKKEIGV